jgi:hypothetical protein
MDTTNPQTTTLTAGGADDPDQLLGVPAGELFDWAWLAGELADWLNRAEAATRADSGRHFDGLGETDKTALFLSCISERTAALLDGDRGQP